MKIEPIKNLATAILGQAWISVLVVAALIFVSSVLKGTPGKIITSDGNAYYAWLTTLSADADLKFRNDFMNLYAPDPVDWIENTQGDVRNVTPPGMAVVMLPGFALAHVLSGISNVVGWGAPSPYDPFYKNITAAWLLALFIFGVWAFQRTAEILTGNKFYSALASLGVALATNLIHYIAKEPSMGHATVFALTAINSHLILKQRNAALNFGAWFAAGALVGMLLIVRNSCVVLMPWWLALGWTCTESHLQTKIKAAVCAMLAAAIVFAIQPLMLSLMNNSFTLNGYSTYGFSSGFEGIWKGLLSARHGLLVYHPLWIVFLFAVVAGLKIKSLRLWALAAIASFCMALLINGTWPFWWFGDSFGNRAYIDVLAPCALVAAAALHERCSGFKTSTIRWAAGGVTSALIAANLLLWLGYLLRRFPSDGLHTYAEAWLWWLR